MAGKTLEELRREVQMLKAKQANIEDLKRIQREREQLVKEIKMLKNPNSVAFKQNLRRGLSKVGKGSSKAWSVLSRMADNWERNENSSSYKKKRK